jgi:putative methionine-R-sulfoxide reductase with GAF domain
MAKVAKRARPGAHNRADPLALLNELARIATQDLALRPMLQRITDALASRLGIELVSLVRVDRVARCFVCEALTCALPTEVHVGYSRELGSGIVGRVAETGKALLLDDVADFPGYVQTLAGTISELCLPILHHGEVVALLNLESPRPAAFRGQLPLFSAVADQVSGAIASARLYDETRRRALFLEVVSEVSRTALAGGELREVLGRVTRFVQERFELILAAIVVANDAATEWEHRAIALRPGLTLPPRKRWPVSAGIVGRAIRTGEPQLVFDVANDPDFFGMDPNITCEYAVPLRFQGRIVGAFNVESGNRAVLAEENLALFRTIAEQVVGRIELALVNQKLQDANRELAALALRDALTGVANRRQFDEVLEAEWRRARRTHAPLALAIADVDHFKAYNDACGHQADACLQAVAANLHGGAPRRDSGALRWRGICGDPSRTRRRTGLGLRRGDAPGGRAALPAAPRLARDCRRDRQPRCRFAHPIAGRHIRNARARNRSRALSRQVDGTQPRRERQNRIAPDPTKLPCPRAPPESCARGS